MVIQSLNVGLTRAIIWTVSIVCIYHLLLTGCVGKPDLDRHRRNGIREDHSNHTIPRRRGFHRHRQDRVHPAASCGCHVGGQASGRGVRVPVGPGSWLHHSIRGLHVTGDAYQVHDRRYAVAGVSYRL